MMSGGLSLREMQELPIFAPTLMTTVKLENLGAFEQTRGTGWIRRQNQCRIARIYYEILPTAIFHTPT